MAISAEYRLYVEGQGESDPPPALDIGGGGGNDDDPVFLSTPHNGLGEHDLFLKMSRSEALELRAILGVLTDTASAEEERLVGVVTR